MRTLVLSAVLALIIVMRGASLTYGADEYRAITINLDGKKIDFGETNGLRTEALTIYDYAYVPIAKIIEILTGAAPSWNDATKTASFTYNGKKFDIDTTKSGISVDGKFIASPTGTPPVIVNSRTLIPLRMLSEALNINAEYVALEHTTYLKTMTASDVSAENQNTENQSMEKQAEEIEKKIKRLGADKVSVSEVDSMRWDRQNLYKAIYLESSLLPISENQGQITASVFNETAGAKEGFALTKKLAVEPPSSLYVSHEGSPYVEVKTDIEKIGEDILITRAAAADFYLMLSVTIRIDNIMYTVTCAGEMQELTQKALNETIKTLTGKDISDF